MTPEQDMHRLAVGASPSKDVQAAPLPEQNAHEVKQALMRMAREVAGLKWSDRYAIGQAIAIIDRAYGDARALAALSQGWRPIETAPKDGSAIWVVASLYAKPFQYECNWNGAEWYHGFGDAWAVLNPTHWMPLPAAPKAADGSGGETA